jgi:hypothetical protein
VSDHLIAEANRHAKALHQMTLPTTKPNQSDIDWYIAECIDLRSHLRIACKKNNDLEVRGGFYEREIARLRADQLRLDWLAHSPDKRLSAVHDLWINNGDIADLRAAIDAARKEQP